MKRYLSTLIPFFIILTHIRYFSWVIGRWNANGALIYPLAVLLSSIYFFYRISRGAIPKKTNRLYPNKQAMLLISLAVGILLFAYLRNGHIWLAGLSLPLAVHGALSWRLGKGAATVYVFPTYLLFLLIPAHQLLMPYLNPIFKEGVARGTALLVNLLGIQTFKNGLTVYTRDYYVMIVDGCSGLDGLAVALFFGVNFAYLTQKTLSSRAAIFLSAILFMYLINIVRVAGMLYAGTFFGSGPALQFFHGPACLIIYISLYPFLLFEGHIFNKVRGKL